MFFKLNLQCLTVQQGNDDTGLLIKTYLPLCQDLALSAPNYCLINLSQKPLKALIAGGLWGSNFASNCISSTFCPL